MSVCDLGAAEDVVHSQGSSSVPAGPGLWPRRSCLGVFVRACRGMSFLTAPYMHDVWVLRQLSVHGGGRVPRDVMAAIPPRQVDTQSPPPPRVTHS